MAVMSASAVKHRLPRCTELARNMIGPDKQTTRSRRILSTCAYIYKKHPRAQRRGAGTKDRREKAHACHDGLRARCVPLGPNIKHINADTKRCTYRHAICMWLGTSMGTVVDHVLAAKFLEIRKSCSLILANPDLCIQLCKRELTP